MKNFNIKEKIIVITFVVLTVVVLWLISPMGRVYMPIDKSHLEKSLSFEVPDGYDLKNYKIDKDYEIYHLYYDKVHPHVVSIITFEGPVLTFDDANFLGANKPPIRSFWFNSGLIEQRILDCSKEFFNKNKFEVCSFKANKTGLNEKTVKEGEFALLKKDGKSVFVASVASENAYQKEILRKIVKSINK